MSRIPHYLAALAITLAILPSALAATIVNPLEAPSTRTIEYEEVWRAGADDQADYVFGVIMTAITDDHRNIYLLDSQQQQVHKFSPEGAYRGLVSRRGEGPGEIENVYNMHYLGGGQIGLLKAMPPCLVKVDTTGLPLPSLPFELPSPDEEIRFGMVFKIQAKGGLFYGQGQFYLADRSQGSHLEFVDSFDAEGHHIHTFGTWRSGYDFSRPIEVNELASHHPLATWDIDNQGRLFHTVSRDSFRIDITNPDGTLAGRIFRPCARHRRTDQEKDEAKQGYSFSSGGDLPPISYKMADYDAVIPDLKVIGDELWVSTSEGMRDGRLQGATIVDAFDLDGHLTETRIMKIPQDSRKDSLTFLPDGRVVRVKNLDAAVAGSSAGLNVQQGEERNDGTVDQVDDTLLEVIVYRPVSR